MTPLNAQAQHDDYVLQVRSLSIILGGIRALEDVSINVRRGAVVGIVGPNGAGKTSLLNCINGVYPATSGQIIFEGEDITQEQPYRRARRGIARTFQNMELISDASVTVNILAGRDTHISTGLLASAFRLGWSRRQENQSRAAVEETIKLLELTAVRDRLAGSLPAGQRKAVEVARALVMEPRLLLLDEPSGGMSHGERARIARQIVRIRDSLGVTQVLIEHDLRFVRDLCDYVYVLDFGKLLTEGTPEEALADPRVLEVYGGAPTS